MAAVAVAGLALLPLAPKAQPELGVLAELRAKTHALEKRRKEVEALQHEHAATQGSMTKKSQQVACLEEDIMDLKRALSSEEGPQVPPVAGTIQ